MRRAQQPVGISVVLIQKSKEMGVSDNSSSIFPPSQIQLQTQTPLPVCDSFPSSGLLYQSCLSRPPSIVELYQPISSQTNPPLTTRRPLSLQFSLCIHQSCLNPHPISPIASHALTIQQLRQRALDLLVHHLQLSLVLFNLSDHTLIDDGR